MREAVLDFGAERHDAQLLLFACGSFAAQRASDNADRETRNHNPDKAAYWRRVTAFILAVSPAAISSGPG